MDILQQTLNLCKKYNIKPARSKGQNFLITEEVYNQIIEASDLKKDDIVLEVGPGLGFLTRKLAEKAKKVIAIELDDKLAGLLKTSLINEGIKNVEVINENILDLSLRAQRSNLEIVTPKQNFRLAMTAKYKSNSIILRPKAEEFQIQQNRLIVSSNQRSFTSFRMTEKYKIVANLPYNITSIFLRKFLEEENRPESMVLMLQKEVAERIAAKPGEMSLLAVSVQLYGKPKIINYVSKSDFWPSPEVDSAVIKININTPFTPLRRSEPLLIEGSDRKKKLTLPSPYQGGGKNFEKDFFRLVKIGFSSKRKMLKNNLANGYHISQEKVIKILENAGFSEKIRAQELGVDDWIKLLASFK